ncbi:MAG: PqqD family protein [Elusimicrobia bacterium]|nr:PqqD family protein [Elusimicrobiota bacterium]
MANLYERLTRKSWGDGKFRVDPGAMPWQEPTLEAQPEGLRDKLRAEMERIAEAEREDMTMETKTEGALKLAKFVKFREEKFGGVLFETRQEKVYTLNQIGAAIVREIAAGGEGCVVERLKAKFEDPTGALEADAKEYIADLKAKGLIVE